MFCPNCGKEQKGSPAYCSSCGVKLVLESSSTPSISHANVVEYAGFWKRFAASIIDGILLWIASFIVGFIIASVFYDVDYEDYESAVIAILYLAAIILYWLYYATMESSSKQATLGKMALGIVVTDNKGSRISFGRATGRYFAKIISTLILLIGYIMIAFTERKQGLHDMIAETLVVVK